MIRLQSDELIALILKVTAILVYIQYYSLAEGVKGGSDKVT
ncbi:hypothetical protein [Sphingobacterium bambusae]|uniref:Uncharacterized protein n=1 Tax=Sphingobacterium bambusae TaxID=662858 RepID=A0ABW6BDE2_9SPHI|nr:hypothetical protein [Sphingobacterium bambusae]WPL46870.1 hypothetical protein SCB77_12955 [Sphingobacterium bambusae]